MGYVIKTILIIAIVGLVGATIQAVIPSSFSASINDGFTYFLTAMMPMNFIIPMDAVYTSIQILGNFVYALAIFVLIRWLVHLFAK